MDRREQQRQAIRAQCAARGINIEPLGACFALRGPGVDLIASDLANLDENDLAPYQPRKVGSHAWPG